MISLGPKQCIIAGLKDIKHHEVGIGLLSLSLAITTTMSQSLEIKALDSCMQVMRNIYPPMQ